jgi:hypothetical protein
MTAPDLKFLCGSLAAITGFIQYTPYVINILRRKTRPHAFSWFVWGLPCGIVFAAQFLKGGAAGSYATGVTAILCTIIFFLSLFYGEKNITKLDWLCLVLALAALVLWGMTKDPLGSVILVTIADLIGFGPTIRKSIKKPREETASTYWIANVKWVLSLMAMNTYSLTVCLYPVAMFVANSAFAVMLFVRRAALAIKVQ